MAPLFTGLHFGFGRNPAVAGSSDQYFQASGGDSTGQYSSGGFTYKYHAYTSTGSATLTIAQVGQGGPASNPYAHMDFLVIGGGGGGAGGYRTNMPAP